MRDGNQGLIQLQFFMVLIPILPMRDGNAELPKETASLDKIPILPMRDGNRYCGGFSDPHSNDSDPTYEGWKRFKRNCAGFISGHSDPTYEGWKQRDDFPGPVSFITFRSYLWGMET